MEDSRIRILYGRKMWILWMVMARVDGKQRGITQIRLKHDLNQQQELDLGQKLNITNSETELCKGYGANGCRAGNKYGGGLWDKRQKTLKVKR